MNRRHQVFVSSTYEDLKDERQAVTLTLLEHQCIPVGMELFPAGDHDPWKLIKRIIDESDYYFLIIAGKYGSTTRPGGLGYTEREYRYARKRKVPIATFLRDGIADLPSNRVEMDPVKRKMLDEFRQATKRNLVKHWKTIGELTSHVTATIHYLRGFSPKPGWVRADSVDTATALQERIEKIERDIVRPRGKGSYRELNPLRYDDHVHAHADMHEIIENSAKSNDITTIKVIGVSLKFSWPFLENMVDLIANKYKKHITIEVALVSPDHLDRCKLPSWSGKARGIIAAIDRFAAESPPIVQADARLSVVLYENLPHWHGVLINDSALFLGRSYWDSSSATDQAPKLFVGEMPYRLFSSDDGVGGVDRINLFNSWFNYYRISAVSRKEFGKPDPE